MILTRSLIPITCRESLSQRVRGEELKDLTTYDSTGAPPATNPYPQGQTWSYSSASSVADTRICWLSGSSGHHSGGSCWLSSSPSCFCHRLSMAHKWSRSGQNFVAIFAACSSAGVGSCPSVGVWTWSASSQGGHSQRSWFWNMSFSGPFPNLIWLSCRCRGSRPWDRPFWASFSFYYQSSCLFLDRYRQFVSDLAWYLGLEEPLGLEIIIAGVLSWW